MLTNRSFMLLVSSTLISSCRAVYNTGTVKVLALSQCASMHPSMVDKVSSLAALKYTLIAVSFRYLFEFLFTSTR